MHHGWILTFDLSFDLCSLFHSLVFFNARKFNGDLSKWNVGKVWNMNTSTLQSGLPSKRSTILTMFFALFFVQFPSFLSFVFTNVLPMFSKFWLLTSVSLFHFLVFRWAERFNGDLSTWDVGSVTTMQSSTLQSVLPSKRSTILTMFFALFIVQFPSFLFYLYLQMHCQCSANSDFWPLFFFLIF